MKKSVCGGFLTYIYFPGRQQQCIKNITLILYWDPALWVFVFVGFQTSVVDRSPVSAIARVVVSVGVAIAWFVIAITWPAIAAIA